MTDNYIRRLFCMILGLTFVSGVPGQAALAWELNKPIVHYWGQITWWAGATNSQIVDYSADGGYNLIWGSQVETFNRAQQHPGMGVLAVHPAFWDYQYGDLNDPAKKAVIDNAIASLNTYPAFYGYYIGDERPAEDFPAMGELAAYLRAADPDHLAYANISGIWHVTSQQQVDDYRAYLNDYLDIVQPELLSYDCYQMMNAFQGTTYIGKSDWNGYLLNLGIIANAAKKANIPFMNIVQACRWNTGWRTPDSNELRYLVYSTLAYGAQGISYFNWYSNYTAPGPGEPYYNGSTSVGALVPESWNPLVPTDVYTNLIPLNAEFVKVAEELRGLEWIDTYLSGYAPGQGPPGPTIPPGDAAFTISGVPNSLVYTNYSPFVGVLTGLFGVEGATAEEANTALVQNIDYTNSRLFTLHGARNLAIYDVATGTWSQTGQDYATLNLAPGQGVLVRLLPNMGDINNDGRVNNADAAILAVNWQKQSGATWANGDLNGDGKVNDVDATLFAINWRDAPPPPQLVAAVDMWSEWLTEQPGFPREDSLYVANPYSGGQMNASVTTTSGITVTLNGLWGGRNRGAGTIVDNPPDFTEANLLMDWAAPWSDEDQTITISGLEANKTYDMQLWAWEAGWILGYDVHANGVQVVDDFRSTNPPLHNDECRMDFQATSDGSGVVVLAFSDPLNETVTYRVNALRIYDPNPATAVPEPSVICLILYALVMLPAGVFFPFRHKSNSHG